MDAVDRREIDRLAIHMPPRHGKSETVTVRYPLYRLRREPEANVLVTGYNERFARKFGRKTRNLAKTQRMVAGDKAASDEWATIAGGLYMARGVGSPPTGTGFGDIIIDDPIRRREDAESTIYREKVWDWYTDDLYTRLEPGGAIVLVMTLWHEDDLGARAIASEPGRWTILKLPAIALEDDPMGRAQGEPLWPKRYSIGDLNRIKSVQTRKHGARSFEALYQQNPTPKEGTMFQISKIRLVNRAPSGLPSCRGWDLAASEGDGDWTAGVKVSGPDESGTFYVDPLRFQHEPFQRNTRIRQTAELDGQAVRIRVPQDPGSAGKEAAANLVRLLAAFPIEAQTVSGDKMLRAEPFASQVNEGNIAVVTHGTDEGRQMAADYIEELRQAPGGRHDDMIDATSDAYNALNGATYSWDW